MVRHRRKPPWWVWDLELSPHLLRRMDDRSFTEVQLRRMLASAPPPRPDLARGRWVVEARLRRQGWRVIVEPDEEREVIVVITAFPTSGRRE